MQKKWMIVGFMCTMILLILVGIDYISIHHIDVKNQDIDRIEVKIGDSETRVIEKSEYESFINNMAEIDYHKYVFDIKATSDVYVLIYFQDGRIMTIDAYRTKTTYLNGKTSLQRFTCQDELWETFTNEYTLLT